jgi:hypothetical protein
VIASLLAFRDRKASSYPVAPETRLSSYVFKAAKVRALCEGIISGLRSSGSTRGKVGFWVLSRPSAGDLPRHRAGPPLYVRVGSYPDLQRPVTTGLKCVAKLTFDAKRRQCPGLQTYTSRDL